MFSIKLSHIKKFLRGEEVKIEFDMLIILQEILDSLLN